MKIKCIALVLAFFSIGQNKAQTDDPVIMKIAGEDILRSEFEYTFNKNNKNGKVVDKRAIEEYVDMYVNYKLKVKAAIDNKLDTLSSFKTEFEQYRDAQLKPYLLDTMYIDSVARVTYNNIKQSVGDSDILLVSHIMVAVPQKADATVMQKAKLKIDSVYQLLKAGNDFATLAKKYSDDKFSAAKGGKLPWLGPNSALPDFTAKLYAMYSGDISEPFQTTAGYHIVKMHERKPLESYAERKAEIVKVLRNNGIETQAMESGIKKMIQESGGALTREQVIQKIIDKASRTNPDLKNLIQEYRDGLLLYEATDFLVWKPAAKDIAGIEKFFKKNKKNYTWESPRFKGFLLLSKKRVYLEKAVKLVKTLNSREDALKVLQKEFGPAIMKQMIVKYGIFKEGDDPRIDYKRYGKEKPKTNVGIPYFDVVGSMISGPEIYTDEKNHVVSDYQDLKEKEWVRALRNKYSYSVNKNVLDTVNNH